MVVALHSTAVSMQSCASTDGKMTEVDVETAQATPCAVVVPALCAQVHVLNGEKYREVCPENTLLNSMQLRGCIITPHHKKPLLKRESALGVSEEARIFLQVEVRAGVAMLMLQDSTNLWLLVLTGESSW